MFASEVQIVLLTALDVFYHTTKKHLVYARHSAVSCSMSWGCRDE